MTESKGYSFYAGGGFDDYLTDEKEHEPKGGFDSYLARDKNFSGAKGAGEALVLLDKSGKAIDGLPPATAKGSIVWSLIVSLDAQATKENDMGAIGRHVVAETFSRLMHANARHGFKASTFSCTAVVHQNTENHHVHLRLYQPEGTSERDMVERYKLSEAGFQSVKAGVSLMLTGGRAGDREVNEASQRLREEFKRALIIEKGGREADRELARMMTKASGLAASVARIARKELGGKGGNAGRLTFAYVSSGDEDESAGLRKERLQLKSCVAAITRYVVDSNEKVLAASTGYKYALNRQSDAIAIGAGLSKGSSYVQEAHEKRESETTVQLGNAVLSNLLLSNVSWRSRKTVRKARADVMAVKNMAARLKQRRVQVSGEAVQQEEEALKKSLQRKE